MHSIQSTHYLAQPFRFWQVTNVCAHHTDTHKHWGIYTIESTHFKSIDKDVEREKKKQTRGKSNINTGNNFNIQKTFFLDRQNKKNYNFHSSLWQNWRDVVCNVLVHS